MKKRKLFNLKELFSLAGFLSATICVIIFTVFQFIFLDDVFLLAAKIEMSSSVEDISGIDYAKDDYELVLAEYESNHSYYLEIYSPRDVLIYTTASNTIYDVNNENNIKKEPNPRIMSILSHSDRKDGSYFEMRREYFTTSEYLVYGKDLDNNAYVEMYYSLDVIRENARVASWALFALCLLALIAIYSLTMYITNRVTEPLRTIIGNTKKMSEMDFSTSCPSFALKDLNELSESINTLSLTLSRALEKLESENRSLEIDIETQRRHEKSRRSFIANISHELKTPISIIQGYAEGLKLGVGTDSTQEYCDIIIDEVQKMNALVVRLMEYMQYTSGTYKLCISEFSLKEFLTESIESRKFQLKESGIDVILDIKGDCICHSDAVLVENIFNNYLSNAISHIDFDKRIVISVTEKDNCYTVSVFNTGKPILGTDIENIWESFYRADKAHSRAEGRFGLGLSIVATSQSALKENYGVINKEGGPEFWFDISK